MDIGQHDAFPAGLIQVAGVHDLAEAEMLLRAGVDIIGIPLRLTVNAEDLDDAQAARISQSLPGRCCLITYLDRADEICDLAGYLKVRYIQLHGPVPPELLPELKRRMPGVLLIKSLVIGMEAIAETISTMRACAPSADAFITDTFDPDTGAEGATGLVHDWSISRGLVQQCPRPVILAGGLHPGNVAGAIAAVQPRGVDVHTGLEGPDGRKSIHLAEAFVREVRKAYNRA